MYGQKFCKKSLDKIVLTKLVFICLCRHAILQEAPLVIRMFLMDLGAGRLPIQIDTQTFAHYLIILKEERDVGFQGFLMIFQESRAVFQGGENRLTKSARGIKILV